VLRPPSSDSAIGVSVGDGVSCSVGEVSDALAVVVLVAVRVAVTVAVRVDSGVVVAGAVTVAVSVRVAVSVPGSATADDSSEVAEAVGSAVVSSVRVRSGDAVRDRVALGERVAVTDRDAVPPGRELSASPGVPSPSPPQPVRASADSSPTTAPRASVRERAGDREACFGDTMGRHSRGRGVRRIRRSG
jgi:hypothetical protein